MEFSYLLRFVLPGIMIILLIPSDLAFASCSGEVSSSWSRVHIPESSRNSRDGFKLPKHYSIRRIGEYLQLDFQIFPFTYNWRRQKILNENILEKVQQTILELNDREILISPDGKKIILSVNQNSSSRNDQFPIEIKRTSRSNYNTWSENIDKETIIHELFHLAGLVDEYIDHQFEQDYRCAPSSMSATDPNYQRFLRPKWDCRHPGIQESLMGDHESLTSASSSQIFSRVNSGESLLSPAQFYFIFYPSCADINERYNTCSQNAYRETCSRHECIDTPSYCNDPMTWLF